MPNQSKSQAIHQRAKAVIPQGVYGHYGAAIRPTSPVFFDHVDGSRFVDVDGNEYIDWMCAYGPMILGYNHPAVDQAAANQMEAGSTVSLASPVLVDLAEKLTDLVSGVDWALFGKNGADATALAVMVARAATGRRYVIKVDGGYHGTAPWMQGAGAKGTVAEDQGLVITVPWNDASAIQQAIDNHPDDVACFLSSPYHHPVMEDNALPEPGYWPSVEALCRKAGVVVIVDDIRAGFRIDLAGSHVEYGFQPDLICLGKALGNGHPISALVGVEALRQAAGDTFYTGTQFFNAAPMAAALATLNEMEKVDAARRTREIGERLSAGLVDVARSRGHDLRVTGVPSMPYYRLAGEGGFRHHARWVAECVRRGAFLLDFHNHFVSTAHTDDDLKQTWDIADQAFAALSGP
jgi:glutamate-1-semialdehyde 2,1-aminomutase